MGTPIAAMSVIERDTDGAVLCVLHGKGQWRLPGAMAEGVPPHQLQSESLKAQTSLDTHSRELLYSSMNLFAYKVVGFGVPKQQGAPVVWLPKDMFLKQSPHKDTYERILALLPKPRLHAIAVVKQRGHDVSAPQLHYVHAIDSQNAKVKFQMGRPKTRRERIIAVGPVIGYFANDKEGKRLSV